MLIAIPGLSQEDRANRIERKNRLSRLIVDITGRFTTLAQALDDAEGRKETVVARTQLLSDRVELASLVGPKGDSIMRLFDTCLHAVSDLKWGLLTGAASTFSVGAADWLRFGEVRANASKARRKLAADIKRAEEPK